MNDVESVGGRGGGGGEELTKRTVDVFCPQEVRQRGQGHSVMGTEGRRQELQWP